MRVRLEPTTDSAKASKRVAGEEKRDTSEQKAVAETPVVPL